MTKSTQRASQVLVEALNGEVGEEAKPQRAALYARVSTQKQAEKGYSIAGQESRLKAYATAKGWEIAGMFTDAGYSGRSDKRPAYQDMMKRESEWDILAVLKMDRIHRNSKNFINMIDMLRKKGKDFDSMHDSIDTSTSMGRFVMNIIQEIAVLESGQASERTKEALGAAFELKGVRAMGQQAPYGYRWSEGDPKHGTGELVIVGDEAAHVRYIFMAAEAGMGRGKMSEELGWCTCTERVIKQRKKLADGTEKVFEYRGKKANCGGCERVAYISNNPFYAGFQLYQGKILPGDHVALIGRELFESVQAQRPKTRVRPLPEA